MSESTLVSTVYRPYQPDWRDRIIARAEGLDRMTERCVEALDATLAAHPTVALIGALIGALILLNLVLDEEVLKEMVVRVGMPFLLAFGFELIRAGIRVIGRALDRQVVWVRDDDASPGRA